MHRPSPSHRSERVLIARVAIALGLALLLLVGAWSNSHGEHSTGTALCVASGSSTTSVSDQHPAASADTAGPDAAILGICAAIVFLLGLVALRLLERRPQFRIEHAGAASAPPRASPTMLPQALTLVQLSVSRT